MATPIPPEVQAAIDAAVVQAKAEVAAEYESKFQDQQTQIEALKGSQKAPSPVHENAAGVGNDVAETWSQYDQELASAGVHPLQT
jgi:hypothetical protein